MSLKNSLPCVLTVAGSDSGGGAGIQADLKTFTVLKTYGASVITALTAQNTLGVHGVREVEPDFVAAQMDAVLSDLPVAAAKTGMLSSPEIVKTVADKLGEYGVEKLVVDPVMVAKGGSRLLKDEAVEALKAELIPRATILTPNLEEAEVLIGYRPSPTEGGRKKAAQDLLALGCRSVFLKDGHGQGNQCVDLWTDGKDWLFLPSPRLSQKHTHGTGCTLSAAMAARLALGCPPLEAAREGKGFISGAIANATALGGGIGPVNHLWEWL